MFSHIDLQNNLTFGYLWRTFSISVSENMKKHWFAPLSLETMFEIPPAGEGGHMGNDGAAKD